MTDDDIRQLLELKSEGPSLDYKAGFEWSKPNRDLKYELVRDLMALANTKNGGRVVFGVRDADLEFVGVSIEILESIDPTDVLGMLHDNAAPRVRCAVYKREIDGRRVVVFDVAEFEDTPIICTNGVIRGDGSKRIILREGAVYIRTGAAATTEVSSADDMRALISRAVTREAALRSEELMRSVRELLTGTPAGPAEAVDMSELADRAEAVLRNAQAGRSGGALVFDATFLANELDVSPARLMPALRKLERENRVLYDPILGRYSIVVMPWNRREQHRLY